jgi:hypothetical protein
MKKGEMRLMSRGGEREGVDYKMCGDDEKDVKVVATANDMDESGGNNGKGSESATVGDEGMMKETKFQCGPFRLDSYTISTFRHCSQI